HVFQYLSSNLSLLFRMDGSFAALECGVVSSPSDSDRRRGMHQARRGENGTAKRGADQRRNSPRLAPDGGGRKGGRAPTRLNCGKTPPIMEASERECDHRCNGKFSIWVTSWR